MVTKACLPKDLHTRFSLRALDPVSKNCALLPYVRFSPRPWRHKPVATHFKYSYDVRQLETPATTIKITDRYFSNIP
jgi:hypothetical protein